jgi:outer membrane protein OmpA-like peptidoglycan-associated protein
MKTKIKNLATLLLMITASISFSQTTIKTDEKTNEKTNEKPASYWQIAPRVGYDFPMFKEDFNYIKYKGGIMGGLSINKYWNHWGFQTDFDYIKNTPTADIENPNFIANGASTSVIPLSLSTTKKDITRMFFGIGPAYKYQSENNKFTTEIAVLGGLGIIDGGEILVEGYNTPLLPIPRLLTYHSGFDNQTVATLKGQIRANYYFTNNFGANLGVYYMNHFGVNESQKNQILIDKGYQNNNESFNTYFFEQGTQTATIDTPNNGIITQTGFSDFSENEIERIREGEQINEQKKIQLQSVGIFAGVTFKFPNKVKPKKIVEEEVKKEEPIEKKYCVQVTAKDKFTKEILPNTDVALKNEKGEVISTAKTDAFGVTKFCDLLPMEYKIDGVLNEINLESTTVNKNEFKEEPTLNKEIIYSDKNFIIKGKAVECNSTTPIVGISVILENTEKAFKKTTISDNNGNFTMQMPVDGIFQLYGKKENYFSQTEEINASNYNREKTLYVKIEICAEKADCGKAIGLKNILFDLAKYNIREDAKPELDKLVRFMIDNPEVKVELSSHTDCRGSHKYNQNLSQNRANASVAYIISQGIAKERIVAKGYGETKLLNECADGVTCTEEQHQMNRRTEFKVICPEKK